MSKSKKFTLTKKKSVTGGSGKEKYRFTKGDVIGEEELKSLPKRHQSYFEEGVKELSTPSKADEAQDEVINELQDQVENLEERLQRLEGLVDSLANSIANDENTDSKTKKK
ncbi:MAG: hypothetical protein ABJ387_03510 [Balneola sp.]